MFAAILLAVSIIPYSPIIEDRVATYELNHLYDGEGNRVFTQRIWWDDDGDVIAWRLVKRDAVRLRGGWLFLDGDCLRKVRSVSEIETWEQFDRELAERERLPAHERKGLSERP